MGLGSILQLVIRLIKTEPVLETWRQGMGNGDGWACRAAATRQEWWIELISASWPAVSLSAAERRIGHFTVIPFPSTGFGAGTFWIPPRGDWTPWVCPFWIDRWTFVFALCLCAPLLCASDCRRRPEFYIPSNCTNTVHCACVHVWVAQVSSVCVYHSLWSYCLIRERMTNQQEAKYNSLWLLSVRRKPQLPQSQSGFRAATARCFPDILWLAGETDIPHNSILRN